MQYGLDGKKRNHLGIAMGLTLSFVAFYLLD
jgi:hypothetical protein